MQTADPTQQLRVPVERIEWIDHPISEMIALRRLSAYDDGLAEPDTAFIMLFLQSSSFNVLLPVFQKHLSLLHGLDVEYHESASALTQVSRHGPFNLVSNALTVLLRPDLAPDRLLSFWILVYDTRWEQIPDFVTSFFCIIEEGPRSTPEYLGIKWMEAVWAKVLRPRMREVVIEAARLPWPGVEGGEWDKDSKEILYQGLRRGNLGDGEEEQQKEAEGHRLDESTTKVLRTLAELLEVASAQGLVDVDVANAISCSPLLADDKLRQDQSSLGCIEAIIGPLRAPLPPNPAEDSQLPEAHMEDYPSPTCISTDTLRHFSCYIRCY